MAETGRERSALRIYVDRNKIGLAIAGLVLAALGVGGQPLASRLINGAEAAETTKEDIAVLKVQVRNLADDVQDAKSERQLLQDKQRKQANTGERIDDNVMTICRALKIQCKERPAKEE